MLLTICTLSQLPQAIALGDSFTRHSVHATGSSSVILGLVDDPARLPVGFVSPYPLLPVSELLETTLLAELSARYTPTEFAAACKPTFIAEVFRRYPEVDKLLYADPNVYFTGSLSTIWQNLEESTALLTPFITRNPADSLWPDEKFFQNIGLYSSDFLGFRRSAETDKLLAWWTDRVQQRAFINYCEGLCLDQIWLMHVPVFFKDVRIIKNPGWHVALWNLHERSLQQTENGWQVTGPEGQDQPLLFMNVKGWLHPDQGFFPHQNRLRLSDRAELAPLLATYRQALTAHEGLMQCPVKSTYGQQPEPVVLRGWRYTAVQSFRSVTRLIDQFSIPR
ncbi:hypothetical protein [Spirosoma fluviale]|uniref:Uncharacterized protein n=1 Tax=Spirosoma fluviale TaxID=1597977 RepID=A0A286FJS9_9BACT|nr:hypothetical protein [Spirosoma fluviale]SOD83229.1 hypothetical protein SAMN06269250_2406 [Spirosoma fluviale]